MRLHRLRITAFGPFGTTQDIDFDELSAAGLFLLHGQTGAGKTSVLDAVCYGLYGSVPGPRQGSGQGVTLRSDHAEPGVRTEVCLELTVAGRRLEVTRQPPWERPKKRGTGTTTEKAQSWLREYEPGEAGQAGAWKDLSRSHQEVGEEITQLLGMSKEQFCQVVLLPQGDFARFLRADAEARGKLLGRLFDTHRFAAVEQRLAEQRREAEGAVREGDAELLADAHRMQQAAGDALDAAQSPLPDLSPGDPGLADAVLAWAAVARTSARERHTIAGCALTAAESAQAAAGRRLDDVRELDALQRRFALARERAERLRERADEHRQRQIRMERARKAETVAPALGLRRATEEEHRRATDEEARARGHLPATFADSGSAGLAAAARKAAEELGGLESARRAEQRLDGLRTERTSLEREERADDELLREAAGWLDGWAASRTALQERIDSAQEAATRAEHLAGQLEPAQRRLDAARRRDGLAREAAAAFERTLAARESTTAAHEHWLALKEQRLTGIAAELAAGLSDGDPCAVCGATEHPAPAPKDAGHVDRATEESALAAYRQAEERRAEDERQLGEVRESLAAARAAALGSTGGDFDDEEQTDSADGPSVERLAGLVEKLRAEHADARSSASGLHAAREALAQAEREHDRRVAVQQEAAVRAASRTTLRDSLDREQASLEAELSRARGASGSVAARTAQLERQAALLTDAAEAARVADDTAQRLKDADARLADAAFRAGFDTPGDAAEALLDDAGHRELQHRIDEWRNEEAAVRSLLAEPDAAAAAEQPPADLRAAQEAAEQADRRTRAAASALDAAARCCAELDRLSERSAAGAMRLAPLRAEYDRVARLAGLAAGTSADNERKMRLESYVLAARLEQVAAAATARLRRMSSGRYTLVHSDHRTGRGRSGLGLHVVDAWTGRERDTSTLSGGETFFASLALALGLADVVTDEAGGVRLDTLFIDEGFGSLDDQTLDEVLDVLDSLRERDRSVGIVSHVADLRRRVHAQLWVEKGRAGSVVRRRGGA
ncbi:nuclease SbcCD subunit C [Streptomyces longisporoflavus]|uniref:AAA family ATPase n=1 Tax=Streptomyces longisporoflavus TaxID=28044 RepID=UPI00167E216B|nr:SMC family ATPase [Streptomyces longisporoflavus]GGV56065.1 nuclease SbcCD subunit C [Streptomyces longisporoflavus]